MKHSGWCIPTSRNPVFFDILLYSLLMLFVLPNSVFTYFFYFSDHFASHCCDFRPTINLYNDLFFHSTCKHPPKPSPRNAWKLNRPGGHYKKGFDGQLWSIWGALSIQRCYPAELRFVCRGASWRLFVTRCQHLRNLHTLSGLDLNPKVQILHLHYIFIEFASVPSDQWHLALSLYHVT